MPTSPQQPPPQHPQLDPAIIDRAPVTANAGDFDPAQSAFYFELVGELAARLEDVTAENAALKGQRTFDQVKADMAQPYADKVFRFLVGYCAFVGFVILLSGFTWTTFHISDVVLGIIAGSTAVSAIGLVGFVVSGLFGAHLSSPKKKA